MNNITSNAVFRLDKVGLSTKLNTKTKQHLPGYPILQDISFEMLPSSFTTIVGPTGAGKTFLLRLLNRLSEATSGKIYFENQDYTQIPVSQLRSCVVLVSQEPKLLGMTVKDALAYPLVLRGFAKPEIQQRISQWIEQLKIPDDWLGRSEVQLSTGQKQLVALARALVIEPKVLLLDEPTSTLDIGTAQHFLQTLSHLSQSKNTTIAMVNHQLEIIKEFYSNTKLNSNNHRILHLSQGRLLTNQFTSEVDWINLKGSILQVEADDDFV